MLKGLRAWALCLLFLIFSGNLFTAWAAGPFTDGMTGREFIKIANQRGLPIGFRHYVAREPADFDTVTHIHTSFGKAYASWIDGWQVESCLGQEIKTVMEKYDGSRIKIEVEYVPTKNVAQYGRVVAQNIRTREVVRASGMNYTKIAPQYTYATYTSQTSMRLMYYHNNQGEVVLKLKVYSMPPATMIDLTGLSMDEAKARMADIGMPVGYVQPTYERVVQSNGALYGKIYKQSIAPGTLIKEPQMMGVMIYAFPNVSMPDLTNGWTLDMARQEDYLILLQSPVYTQDKTREGLIVSQTVSPGTKLFRRTVVTVGVYKYQDLFNRLDYINTHVDDAVKLLNEKKLSYTIESTDIFEYLKSTFDAEFIEKNDGKVVEAKRDQDTIVLTVLRYTAKTDAMPNLIGMNCQAGIKEVLGLEKTIPGLTHDTEYISTELFKNDGKVIRTSPPAFGEVKNFNEIKIYCGKVTLENPDDYKAKVPDLRGLSPEEAQDELTGLGFQNITTTHEKQLGAVDGTVVDITNQMGFSTIGYKSAKIERVTLHIADITAKEMPVMGHWIYADPEWAKKTLLNFGFRHITFESEADQFVTYGYDVDPGKIIATYPRYKTKLKNGKDTHLTIVVRPKPGVPLPEDIQLDPPAKPDTVRVPGLQLTEAETVKTLKASGLVPEVRYEATKFSHFDNKIKPGSKPAFNTIVKRGTPVQFTVYTLKPVVPLVTFIDEETAVSIIEKNSLKADISYVTTESRYSDNRVLNQSPSAGTMMTPRATVKITVQKYSGMVTMPNLLFKKYGSSVTDFLRKYSRLNHKVVQVTTRFEQDQGKIIKTVPAAGTRLKEKSVVELHVYQLSPDAELTVPNVRYLKLGAAKELVEKKGFKTEIRDVNTTLSSLVGMVAAQSPAGLTTAKAETIIRLDVFRNSGSTASAPGLNNDLHLSDSVSEVEPKIKKFYNNFKDAYESKDVYAITALISGDWGSRDGSSMFELEQNLDSMFNVFDEIMYQARGFTITPDGFNTYKVAYTVAIQGTIFDSGITHRETSRVEDLIKVDGNKVKIIKTLNGSYWSVD